MAADPIHDYLNARQVLEEATRQVQQAVDLISNASIMLFRNWRNVVTPSAGGFPMDLVNAPSVESWPTAQQLGELLKGWHKAKREADNAWRQVPAESRYGLQPPPD